MLVIPAIDLIDGRCVRLHQGRYDRQTAYDGDPVKRAADFEATGFRRLHVVDLDGARVGSGRNREAVKRIVAAVDIPVQTGGGIRTGNDVAELLEAGVAFLILGTVALESPSQVERWIVRWGPEPFVVSLDLRQGSPQVKGWTQASTATVPALVKRISSWGVQQVVCTDVDRDGTLGEPGYPTLRELRRQLPPNVDLIAAGGVSRPDHVTRLKELGLFGAVVGRALYEGDFAPREFALAG